MEEHSSVLSEKKITNINLNEFVFHSQDKEIPSFKRDQSPYYSTVDVPIYESVQAVLRKEIYEMLKLEIDNKLLPSMKNYEEPFEMSKLENGHLTFKGTLKALFFCQQILYTYLEELKSFDDQKKCEHDQPKELYPNPIFNKEETHCEISLSGNVQPLPKNVTSTLKESNIIAKIIRTDNKSQASVKSEHILTDFSSEKASKYLKLSVKESNIIENKTGGEKQKISVQLKLRNDIQKKHLSPSKSLLKTRRRSKAQKVGCGMCDGNASSSPPVQLQTYNSNPLEIKQDKIPVSKKFTCEICNFKARHRREYKLHLENAHPITYSCARCSYRTTKKVHYIRHVRNVHENERPYRCQLCGLAFKRRDALKQHQVVHFKESNSVADPSSNAPFKCKVCKKIVRSAAYLREHMLTHSDERSFLCEVCGASFKTRAVHRNHLNVVHSQGVKALCRYCGKSFSTKYSLKRHTRQHETKGRKQITKIRLWKKQPSSDTGWVPLILGSDLLTSGSSVPIAVAEKEEIVSLSKSECIASTVMTSRGDKLIPSIYPESVSSENFGITINSQIPYVIHTTQDISSD